MNRIDRIKLEIIAMIRSDRITAEKVMLVEKGFLHWWERVWLWLMGIKVIEYKE